MIGNKINLLTNETSYIRHTCILMSNNVCNGNIGVHLSVDASNNPAMTGI